MDRKMASSSLSRLFSTVRAQEKFTDVSETNLQGVFVNAAFVE